MMKILKTVIGIIIGIVVFLAVWYKISQTEFINMANFKRIISNQDALRNQYQTKPDRSVRNLANKFLLKNMIEAEDYYFDLITTNTINCTKHRRLGLSGDGGWDICLDGKYYPTPDKCLSYSFGVSNVWGFDDAVAKDYKCIVRTFDPSMTQMPMEMQRPSKVWFYRIGLDGTDKTNKDGWKMMKFDSLLRKFNERDKIIDILKFDIEYSEWASLEGMYKTDVLSRVKQVMFETHSTGRAFDKLIYFIHIWNQLIDRGFRQWHNHINEACAFNSSYTGRKLSQCYEHYLINVNFL